MYRARNSNSYNFHNKRHIKRKHHRSTRGSILYKLKDFYNTYKKNSKMINLYNLYRAIGYKNNDVVLNYNLLNSKIKSIKNNNVYFKFNGKNYTLTIPLYKTKTENSIDSHTIRENTTNNSYNNIKNLYKSINILDNNEYNISIHMLYRLLGYTKDYTNNIMKNDVPENAKVKYSKDNNQFTILYGNNKKFTYNNKNGEFNFDNGIKISNTESNKGDIIKRINTVIKYDSIDNLYQLYDVLGYTEYIQDEAKNKVIETITVKRKDDDFSICNTDGTKLITYNINDNKFTFDGDTSPIENKEENKDYIVNMINASISRNNNTSTKNKSSYVNTSDAEINKTSMNVLISEEIENLKKTCDFEKSENHHNIWSLGIDDKYELVLDRKKLRLRDKQHNTMLCEADINNQCEISYDNYRKIFGEYLYKYIDSDIHNKNELYKLKSNKEKPYTLSNLLKTIISSGEYNILKDMKYIEYFNNFKLNENKDGKMTFINNMHNVTYDIKNNILEIFSVNSETKKKTLLDSMSLNKKLFELPYFIYSVDKICRKVYFPTFVKYDLDSLRDTIKKISKNMDKTNKFFTAISPNLVNFFRHLGLNEDYNILNRIPMIKGKIDIKDNKDNKDYNLSFKINDNISLMYDLNTKNITLVNNNNNITTYEANNIKENEILELLLYCVGNNPDNINLQILLYKLGITNETNINNILKMCSIEHNNKHFTLFKFDDKKILYDKNNDLCHIYTNEGIKTTNLTNKDDINNLKIIFEEYNNQTSQYTNTNTNNILIKTFYDFVKFIGIDDYFSRIIGLDKSLMESILPNKIDNDSMSFCINNIEITYKYRNNEDYIFRIIDHESNQAEEFNPNRMIADRIYSYFDTHFLMKNITHPQQQIEDLYKFADDTKFQKVFKTGNLLQMLKIDGIIKGPNVICNYIDEVEFNENKKNKITFLLPKHQLKYDKQSGLIEIYKSGHTKKPETKIYLDTLEKDDKLFELINILNDSYSLQIYKTQAYDMENKIKYTNFYPTEQSFSINTIESFDTKPNKTKDLLEGCANFFGGIIGKKPTESARQLLIELNNYNKHQNTENHIKDVKELDNLFTELKATEKTVLSTKATNILNIIQDINEKTSEYSNIIDMSRKLALYVINHKLLNKEQKDNNNNNNNKSNQHEECNNKRRLMLVLSMFILSQDKSFKNLAQRLKEAMDEKKKYLDDKEKNDLISKHITKWAEKKNKKMNISPKQR